jgi:hypothetical protein
VSSATRSSLATSAAAAARSAGTAPGLGAGAMLAAGRYVIYHAGVESGEERWSVEPADDGGAVARGEQVLLAPHPFASDLEWRVRLTPEGRIRSLEVDWRVGTRTLRAEHATEAGRWHARIAHGGHAREQEGDFPSVAEVAFGSHVLHTITFRRYELVPGAEHEFPALTVGPPWFAAEPGRQRLACTAAGERATPAGRAHARLIEVSDPAGGVPPFAAWVDEHGVVLESFEDTRSFEPWMRLVEYRRG